ncbi:MAG: ABC transporter family substrate-binding protein [Sciscionella sp.]|nr:ABC transporter family substrate-binding protein [Sciscionella sp.]
MAALVAPVIAAATLLAACGSGGSSGGLNGNTQIGKNDINPVDVSKLKTGGDFRWGLDQLPDNWNYNEVDGTLLDASYMINAIEPRTFIADAKNNVNANPDYLSSASLVSTDPEVIDYKINPKAKWSNGRPINWEDFQAQANALSGKNTAYQIASDTGYANISKVEKGANDQEVKVTFGKKFAEWKSLFTPLYPKELNSDPNTFNSGWAKAPKITAGPFKVGSIDQTAQAVTLVPDPNWWGQKPKLAKLEFKVISRDALADSMANNTIDYYNIGSSVDLFKRAQANKDVTIRESPIPQSLVIDFNGKPSSILQDQKLRVAIQQGIDTTAIGKALFGPMIKDPSSLQLGNHFYWRGQPQYKDNSGPVKFNQDAAKKALDADGWKLSGQYRKKNGKELDITFIKDNPNPISDNITKLVQSQLAQIGVKVNIKPVPIADFFKSYVFRGDYDMTGYAWQGTSYPVSGNTGVFYLDPKNPQQNYSQVGNQTINKLLDQANSELDDQKRADLANQIDAEVYKTGHLLNIAQYPGACAVRKTVANFGAWGFADIDYTKIGFTQ